MIGRRRFLGAASVGLVSPWMAGRPVPGQLMAPASDAQIVRILEEARTNGRRLPGMIGAIVRGERVAAIGASGVRKVGSPEPIRVEDLVHLGSCTKAMTATLIGTLVDEGKLRWGQTIEETFAGRPAKIHPDFRPVTLRQLLTHRSGMAANAPWWAPRWGSSPTEQRRTLAAQVLQAAPAAKPGKTFTYSNLGYVVAGLMAEEAARAPWDQLLRRRVFEPLGMATAGFGPPGAPGKDDQPWGHRVMGDETRAIRVDNPPWMGPAGTVHCSISDWARFASFHLRGALGDAQLLKPETLRALHTPEPGQTYAGGWIVRDPSWANGPTLSHSGSNTSWFCTICLAPARDLALLVATNAAGGDTGAACDSAIKGMIALS